MKAIVHRLPLLKLLAEYVPHDAEEFRAREAIMEFVIAHSDCFERSLAIGHITVSAWLLDRSGHKALLTHHRKLGKWLQLGGHADGESDVLAVALREAKEESGIDQIEPIDRRIFDVDVHRIPVRKSEPEHWHYDVRFLLRVNAEGEFRVSRESKSLVWVGFDELDCLDVDDSVRRMARKWRAIFDSTSEGE